MAKRASKKAIQPKKPAVKRLKLHKSFKRSYREDYKRELHAPGLLHHAVNTFKIIFKNWKLFLPLVLLATVMGIVLVGMMSEETYQEFQKAFDQTNEEYNGRFGNVAKAGLMLISTVATGGLNQNMGELESTFMIIIFLVLWLVTVYILRHVMAGKKLKLRDALYNALAPLLSTLCLMLLFIVELVPALIAIILYVVANDTGFLSTPFYALILFILAALLILLTIYLISRTIVAMVAVTVPGTYPVQALRIAADVLTGRRVRFIVRLLFLVFVVAIIYVIVMLPIILLDMWLKASFEWLSNVPIVSFFLVLVTTFVFVYASSYIYLFYRRMIESDNE